MAFDSCELYSAECMSVDSSGAKQNKKITITVFHSLIALGAVRVRGSVS